MENFRLLLCPVPAQPTVAAEAPELAERLLAVYLYNNARVSIIISPVNIPM